jgi:hypothetical protein
MIRNHLLRKVLNLLVLRFRQRQFGIVDVNVVGVSTIPTICGSVGGAVPCAFTIDGCRAVVQMLASFEMPIPVNGLCLMSVIFFCACCFIMFLCLFVYKIEPLVRRARLTQTFRSWLRGRSNLVVA